MKETMRHIPWQLPREPQIFEDHESFYHMRFCESLFTSLSAQTSVLRPTRSVILNKVKCLDVARSVRCVSPTMVYPASYSVEVFPVGKVGKGMKLTSHLQVLLR
jgi:hypothetical protein